MRRGVVYIGAWPRTSVCHEYSLALVILAGFISMAPPPDEAAWPLAADSQLLAAAVTPLPPV